MGGVGVLRLRVARSAQDDSVFWFPQEGSIFSFALKDKALFLKPSS